jgi:D-glycero-D-manno-heptose 1,7-bisphosphate phosphatase
MNKAIFLDRDGTINEEMGYINHASRFQIFNFVPEAIKIFNTLGFKVIVVTNQSGVARGYYGEERVHEVHEILKNRLTEKKAKIDKFYFCPHHPTEGDGRYKIDCDCRKPKPGMVLKAKNEFNIDLDKSYMIGDRNKDIVFGKNLGLKTCMVLTGYGLGEYTYQRKLWAIQPDFIDDNLLASAKRIQTLEA